MLIIGFVADVKFYNKFNEFYDFI